MKLLEVYNQFCNNAKFICGMYDVNNFSITLTPLEFEYTDRLFSLDSAIALCKWYLGGNRDDNSICQYLPLYAVTVNTKSPFFNSNYGYYLFAQNNLNKCIDKLLKDKYTRQACIMINNNDIMFSDDNDKLCTNSISFRIIDNKLNMTVQMRSNHFINNMLYDIFTFHMIYKIVFDKLKKQYCDLQIGNYYHMSLSTHVNTDQYYFLRYNSKIFKKTKIFDFSKINDFNNFK